MKEEIRKILYNKTMIVFMGIRTIFNIGLIIATSSKSGEWKKMSENYEYQSGQEIFKDIDGSELGLAYYDERYQKSNTLVAWMHEKYQKLELSLEMLSEQQADRDWMVEYGATIESEEFTDIENKYHEIIAEIEKSMVQKKAFVECDVKNYKEFLEYQTNALNGKEG